MENSVAAIKEKVEMMRDEAYANIQRAIQSNEIVYHRAEMETLEKVLKVIEENK